jgi:hypothetical protein
MKTHETKTLPAGTLAGYCISCRHESGELGSWLFLGDSHKTGEQISPFFPGLLPFFQWCQQNGWSQAPHVEGRPLCMIKQ